MRKSYLRDFCLPTSFYVLRRFATQPSVRVRMFRAQLPGRPRKASDWFRLATFGALCEKYPWNTRLTYEGRFYRSEPSFISMQPLGKEHANIPHMRAMDVPFHLIYGSLIYAKRLESDGQNKVACFQTPGGHQNMIIKYLSVGQWF